MVTPGHKKVGSLLVTKEYCSLWCACYFPVPYIMSRKVEKLLVFVSMFQTVNYFLLSGGAKDINTWAPGLKN